MQMTTDQITELEREAELNDGHCGTCHQTIKFYSYKINRTHANFLRAMVKAVSETGENDVDISTLGLPYSSRSQVAKIRQHGLIARIKNEDGAQIANHWLITHKGWDFLNGVEIPSKVIVFSNQVLGHEGESINIGALLDEPFDKQQPTYTEAPVTEPEARTYEDVRTPKKHMEVTAVYRGSRYNKKLDVGETYRLAIERLQVGHPVIITMPHGMTYKDIASFQKDWKAI